MIKESVREEDITLVHIYAPNTRAPKYINQRSQHGDRNRRWAEKDRRESRYLSG